MQLNDKVFETTKSATNLAVDRQMEKMTATKCQVQ